MECNKPCVSLNATERPKSVELLREFVCKACPLQCDVCEKKELRSSFSDMQLKNRMGRCQKSGVSCEVSGSSWKLLDALWEPLRRLLGGCIEFLKGP